MNTKRQRPSPSQWAKLDAALQQLRERTPPGLSPSLSREITRRAAALRAALESGWRIRDLAAFFREAAGIDVSPSTIQAALRQALNDSAGGGRPDSRRIRAKRPRKFAASGGDNGIATETARRTAKVQPGNRPAPAVMPTGVSGTAAAVAGPAETSDLFTQENPDAPRAPVVTPLGSTFTPGATKRGQR
ncbi:MAG: hypothetical protein V4793_07240 [Paraburkholderia tropica]|uniref:hypothetical protein n=1 Tax=Paraburkholderia tropica TaxID=92647 RepID=UPI001623176B|nr:hypothetical protein [Paraburkholderia tropica]MBB2984575.1 hypothetical protein [Paraburkholderia tropica]